MSYDIQYSDTFKRGAKALAKKYPSLKHDLGNLVNELTQKPDMGQPLGNNMYKIRMSISSKGREIYDKSDYESVDEQKILKNLQAEGFDL